METLKTYRKKKPKSKFSDISLKLHDTIGHYKLTRYVSAL